VNAIINVPGFIDRTAIYMLILLLQVSAVNAFFIILVSIAMLNGMVQKFVNYVMIVWASIVVLVYMIYQLQVVQEDIIMYNCTEIVNNKVVV